MLVGRRRERGEKKKGGRSKEYRRECGENGQGLDKEQETTRQTGSKLFSSE